MAVMDAAHAALVYGLVAASKPQYVLELGIGQGALTQAILQALQFNEYGRLTSVDNLSIFGGTQPDHFPFLMQLGAQIVIRDEKDFCENIAKDDTFDLLVADADHSFDHMNSYSRIVKTEGIILIHNTGFDGEQGFRYPFEWAANNDYPYRLFQTSSRKDENCGRGILMVVNRKERSI